VSSPEDPRLSAALDELYDVDPDDFVATRKRLVGALRSDGEKTMAKVVDAARRPTTAAWALNQLRRREPDRLTDFLDRSRELRAASRDEMRAAIAAQRAAFNELTDAALAILGSRANDTYRSQITATLHAATADKAIAAQLEEGRLTKEIDEVGFPFGGLDPADAGPSAPREPVSPTPIERAPSKQRARRSVAPKEPSAAARRRAAQEEQKAATAREAEARRAAERERLDAELQAAAAESEAAANERDVAEQAMEDRRAELDAASREARAAADRARQAQREVARLMKERARLD
jgi:hypothetical protein